MNAYTANFIPTRKKPYRIKAELYAGTGFNRAPVNISYNFREPTVGFLYTREIDTSPCGLVTRGALFRRALTLGNAGLGEGRHFIVQRAGLAQQRDRDGGAAALAEAHAEIEQRVRVEGA